jgi:hypothetical protein
MAMESAISYPAMHGRIVDQTGCSPGRDLTFDARCISDDLIPKANAAITPSQRALCTTLAALIPKANSGPMVATAYFRR